MYFSCTLLSFTITQTQVLSESSFLEICIRVVCYFPLTYRPCNNLVEESDRTSHTASRLLFTGINVEMKRWGTVIGVVFGLFFYPLSGDFFSRNQTAVFRNTEGDSLPNVINFQVPRVRIWPKKKLKNLNTTPSPVPLCPFIQTLLPALLNSILNQIFAFGMPFTMNYGEPIDNYLRLFHGFLKKELKIKFAIHLL